MGADSRNDLRVAQKKILGCLNKMETAIRKGHAGDAKKYLMEAAAIRTAAREGAQGTKALRDFERSVGKETARLEQSLKKIKVQK